MERSESTPVPIPRASSSHDADHDSPDNSFQKNSFRQTYSSRINIPSFSPNIITITSARYDAEELAAAQEQTANSVVVEGDVETALLPGVKREGHADEDAKLVWAYRLSWVVNWLLLLAKTFAFLSSYSKAVLASLADSAVDLASQGVIAVADAKMKRANPRFPVGRARLEAVGVIFCACIMSLSSFEVIQYALMDLYNAIIKKDLPHLELGWLLYVIMLTATALKVVLYIYCNALREKSDNMVALAEDHLNDVLSNVVAIVTAAVASFSQKLWWVDPVGALLISVYIIWRWGIIVQEQVNKIVGRGAPREFIEQLEGLANTHHDQLEVDVIRAYHFGARFIVEMEVVMPSAMTVAESHDIALVLQHKVEELEEVERAFVHVDYVRRQEPEHKVERSLMSTADSGSVSEPILGGLKSLVSGKTNSSSEDLQGSGSGSGANGLNGHS